MRDLTDEILSRQCCWPRCNRVLPEPGFPICRHHALKVVDRYQDEFKSAVDAMLGTTGERLDRAERYEQALLAQAQVYYVRIGDHIKIGYTTNLKTRLDGLRLYADAVLATEPGSRDVEKARHQQFAAERVGKREDFNPSPRLLAHIEQVRAEHGEPRLEPLLPDAGGKRSA